MFNEHELRHHLQEISVGAKFVKVDFVSAEEFSVELKCRVERDRNVDYYDRYVSEWIKKFCDFTATVWIMKPNKEPTLKILAYRKFYVCHRYGYKQNEFGRTEPKSNYTCRAKIGFKVRKINKDTKRRDPHPDLDMTVMIDFIHSHLVWTPESFHLSETDDIIHNYFDNGYSASAAKYYHELTLIEKYDGNSCEYLSNENINPSMSHVQDLYDKRKEASKGRTVRDVIAAKKTRMEKIGVVLKYVADPERAIIITPIMKRTVLGLPFGCVIIDSTTIASDTVVTLIYLRSKVGALPIACLLHKDETEECFSTIFTDFKAVFENEFSTNFEPGVIFCNDHKEVRNALMTIFPTSKLITSRFSMRAEFCKWLCDEKTKIEPNKRHLIMLKFETFIRADSTASAEENFQLIKKNEYITSSDALSSYLDTIWKRRDEWLVDSDHVIHGNLVEASIRLMKEFFLQKCKYFKLDVMIDVVANIVEKHCQCLLIGHCKGDQMRSVYTKFLAKTNLNISTGSGIECVDPDKFRINYPFKSKEPIDINYCDCDVGSRAQFCEHLCAVINTVDTKLMRTSILTEEEKMIFAIIAGVDMEDCVSIKTEPSDDKNEAGGTNCDNEIDKTDYLKSRPSTALSNSEIGKDYLCLTDVVSETNRRDPPSTALSNSKIGKDYLCITDVKSETDRRDPPSTALSNSKIGKDYLCLTDVRSGTDRRDPPLALSNSDIGKDHLYLTNVRPETGHTDALDKGPQSDANEQDSRPSNGDTASPPNASNPENLRTKYETVLKAVNDEFRRLNRYFRENPNSTNMKTMVRLARELSKIRAVEEIDLSGMSVELNENPKKRKRIGD